MRIDREYLACIHYGNARDCRRRLLHVHSATKVLFDLLDQALLSGFIKEEHIVLYTSYFVRLRCFLSFLPPITSIENGRQALLSALTPSRER